MLREKGLMAELGEKDVEIAKNNGMWDAPTCNPIIDEQIESFAEKLVGLSPTYENLAVS